VPPLPNEALLSPATGFPQTDEQSAFARNTNKQTATNEKNSK
jgi:hypothetical protein